MSRPELSTDRIRLVPMTPAHLPLLVELDSDPEVLRYLLGRARTEPEAREFWGPVCADTAADAVGLGWWVGFRRDDDAFLGWWDLSPAVLAPERPTDAEAGWRLVRRHWRQGYASEGASALLTHGFTAMGLSRVWAETMAVNAASRGVMAKLGMRHVRTEHRTFDDPLPGTEHGEAIYEITRAEWAATA